MNDKQIKTFFAVAACGSFNKAADIVFLSKQATIKQINALEKELGFSLIRRDSSGATLTEAGTQFLAETKKLQLQFHNSVLACRHLAQAGLSLRISCCEAPHRAMCRLIEAYSKQGGHLTLIQRDPAAPLSEALASADLVYDCSAADCGRTNLHRLVLDRCVYRCLMSPDHPYAASEQLSIAQLARQKVAVCKAHCSTTLLQQSNAAGVQLSQLPNFSALDVTNWCLSGNLFLLPESDDSQLPALTEIWLADKLYCEEALLYCEDKRAKVSGFLSAAKEA